MTFKSENEEGAVVARETAGADISEDKLMHFYIGTSLFTSKYIPH